MAELASRSQIVIGNTLVMLSERGELIWGNLDNTTFTETHRQQILPGLCWSQPVLIGTSLYARDAQGVVVRLDLE